MGTLIRLRIMNRQWLITKTLIMKPRLTGYRLDVEMKTGSLEIVVITTDHTASRHLNIRCMI